MIERWKRLAVCLLLAALLSHTNATPANRGKRLPSMSTHLKPTDRAEDSARIESSTLVIGTVDGLIIGLDPATGDEKWTTDIGRPLFSRYGQYADGSVLLPSTDDDSVYIMTWPKDNSRQPTQPTQSPRLLRIPLSVEELVKHSPYISKDSYIFGSKDTRTFGIDVRDGNIFKSITSTSTQASEEDIQEKDKIWIMAQYYTIKALDLQTQKERWNVSAGEYYSSSSFSILGSEMINDPSLILVPDRNGRIYCFSSDEQTRQVHHKWKYAPPSTVISAYLSGRGPVLLRNNRRSATLPRSNEKDQHVVIGQTKDGDAFAWNTIHLEEFDGISHLTDGLGKTPHLDAQISVPFLHQREKQVVTLPYPEDETTSLVLTGTPSTTPVFDGAMRLRVEHDSVEEYLGVELVSIGPKTMTARENHVRDQNPSKMGTLDLFSLVWRESSWPIRTVLLGILPWSFITPFIYLYKWLRKLREKSKVEEEEPSKGKEGTTTEDKSSTPPPETFQPILNRKEMNRLEKEMRKKKKSVEEETEEKPDEPVKIGQFTVTDKVLGLGHSGTVVYEGSLRNKKVAVKRMLRMFYEGAFHEMTLLLEIDHPNIVRYLGIEEDDSFVYIALTHCKCSLYEWMSATDASPPQTSSVKKDMLTQICRGIEHIHSLNIVHQDLKPQNVLIDSKNQVRITDMGCSIQMKLDQSSFTANPLDGSQGWQAPEVLQVKIKSNLVKKNVKARGSKKCDIFSLGCLFHYVITGNHPFGETFHRESNIVKGNFSEIPLEEGMECNQLVKWMIQYDPIDRPTVEEVMMHPYFWSDTKRLTFFKDASDRFEVEKPTSPMVLELENYKEAVMQSNWKAAVDPLFLENLGEKYRKYTTDAIRCLLRVIRNKIHHYYDLPEDVRELLGPLPSGFLRYFTIRFPKLMWVTYSVLKNHCREEPHLREYFT
ncbi:hypothetical protein PROFUN_05272 [Planoprotostelium fungivorum]|uniref:non-specific serine/threonine protein kinase n=1 Tax=Planoprotostelium fungivorum TaxID=1890364 RepID=A0A2P6NRC7_9EUKA|nr:hypothetical protein PROFUN_05272 [Planoprotostelium fungivorum]